jgi:primosomal protein N'
LEKFDQREIDEDILLLRVLIKRVAAFVLSSPKDNSQTFSQRLTAMRVITYAMSRLEKLQRTQLLLRGPREDRLKQAMDQALDELRDKEGWEV